MASKRAAALLIAVAVGAVALWPLARLLGEALRDGTGGVAAALTTPAALRAAWHTAVVAMASAALSTVLGGGFAILAGVTDLPGRRVLGFLFTLLLLIPSQVTAVAWIELLGAASPVLGPLGLAPAGGMRNPLYGPGGLIGLLGVENAPLVFLVLRAGLRQVDGALLEAAQASGSGAAEVIWRVVLPLGRPALVAGATLAAVSAAGNFGTAALLGIPGRYPVLTTLIYQRLSGFGPGALGGVAALSLPLVGLALVGFGAERALVGQGATDGERQLALLPLRRPRICAAACWVALAGLLGLPMVALAGTALVQAYGQPLAAGATLANFAEVLARHPATGRALANSFVLAGTSAAALAAAAVLGCWLALRWRGLAAVLAVAELGYVLPGTVLAVGCILAYSRPVLGVLLYDTLGIILIAYLGRFWALVRRPVAAALRGLDPALEEAAQMAGAAPWRRFQTVVAPQVLPAAAAGGLLVFLTAFNELTVSALLWSAGHETIGVEVFSFEQAGEVPLAAALSCVSVAMTVALMGGSALLGRRLPAGALPWQG